MVGKRHRLARQYKKIWLVDCFFLETWLSEEFFSFLELLSWIIFSFFKNYYRISAPYSWFWNLRCSPFKFWSDSFCSSSVYSIVSINYFCTVLIAIILKYYISAVRREGISKMLTSSGCLLTCKASKTCVSKTNFGRNKFWKNLKNLLNWSF